MLGKDLSISSVHETVWSHHFAAVMSWEGKEEDLPGDWHWKLAGVRLTDLQGMLLVCFCEDTMHRQEHCIISETSDIGVVFSTKIFRSS